MSNKLTARLSDGTEWEVMSGPYARHAGYPDAHDLVVRPIRPEPREWWCVFDYNLRTHQMFRSKDEALEFYSCAWLDRKAPFLVREVLE